MKNSLQPLNSQNLRTAPAATRLFRTLLALSAILIAPLISFGQTFTGTGNWSNPARWSTGVVPTGTSSVIIDGTCTLDASFSAASVTINATRELIGGGGFLQIRDGWTNNGTFTAGTSTVTFTTSTGNAQISGLPTAFHNLTLGRFSNDHTVVVNAAVTANSLTLLRGNAEVNPAGGSLVAGSLTVNNATGQLSNVRGTLTINGNVSVPAVATLGLLGAATHLRIGGNLTLEGTFNADNLNVSVTFSAGTPSVISGGNVNLPATVRINKTGGALTSFAAGTAAAIGGALLVDSPLEVNRTLVVDGTTTVNGIMDVRAQNITFNSDFIINAGGTFSTLASPSNVFLQGNWVSSRAGAAFNSDNSTLILTGGANSTITPGVATQFNGITIQKTGSATVSYNTNPLILRSDLNILSGALLCANTTSGVTSFTPSTVCVGEEISIPNPDLSVGGDVSIGNMAALRLDEDNFEDNLNGISMWVNGALTDNNLEEPTYPTPTRQARGLLIGTQNVALRISNLNRPFIVFTGGDMVVKGQVPQLRDSEGTPSQGLGISLPNVVIYKTDNTRTFAIHSGANPTIPGDKHKLRILGNLTVARGRLLLNSTSLLFGDSRNDEVNVYGILDANAGSTLKMTTGGASPSGSILRGRRGGVVRFVGTPSQPVTVTREGQPGYYYGIAIYAGCSVYAYSTNFSFLTASNEDYNTLSPEQTILNITQAGNGCALPGTGGYESYGGFKIYQGALINPDNQTDLLSAAPFTGAEYNFSYCTFGGSANGMSHLTINTGQTLTIRNILFTLPNGDPGTSTQKFSNIVANNPSTNNLTTTPTPATPVDPPPAITVLSSTGNAAGLNAEYFDGGDFELGYPNPSSGTVPNGGKGRIVWESLPFFFWVGGYDTQTFNRPSEAEYRNGDNRTDWTNWKNWSLAENDPFSNGLATYNNPERIFPGQRTLDQATCRLADRPDALPARVNNQPDALDYYNVFICRSAVTDPILNTAEVTIRGSLVINSGVTINTANNNAVFAQDNTGFPNLKVNRFNINNVSNNVSSLASSVVNNFRILYTGNNILNVSGDLVAEVNGVLDATGNGTIRVGGNMFMMANLPYNGSIPPGNASSTYNSNQANANTTFQYLYRAGRPTVVINGIGLQEMRIRRNVLHNLIIEKPYNEVQIQGLSNTSEIARFTVNNDLTIRSGGLKMLSNTPMLVNGNFTLQGGTFNYNQKTYLTVRGNWQNTGGSTSLGSESPRINFHPWNASPRTVLSAGQPFPQANFGHQDDATNFTTNYEIDRTPELYPSTGAFSKGIFGVNSNIVPYLQKSAGSVDTTSVTNLDAPNLPKALAATNVTYTILDNFTSSSLTTIYPNRTVTTVAGTKTIIRTVGMTIQSNGVVDLKGGSELLLETSPATAPGTNTLLVSAGATLRGIGTPTADVKISRQNTSGSFTFRVDGTITARYYHFEFMDANGVDMRAVTARAVSPGLLYPALPFDASTNPNAGCFSDGLLTNGADGGTLLYFGENTVTTNTVIYNANFPLNPGPGSHNVRQMPFPGTSITSGTLIYFRDATGVFAGENFDSDANDAYAYTLTPPVPPPAAEKTFYGNIRWIDRIKRWTGAGLADTRWNNPENWTDNTVPTVDDDIVLDFSSPAISKNADFTYGYVVTIDGVPAVCRNLTVLGVDANGIATTTNQKIFIILTSNNNHPDSDLNIAGDYSADGSADLRISNGAVNDIRVGKSWSNEGRFRGQSSHALPVSPLDQDEADLLGLSSRGVPFTVTNGTGGTVQFTGNVGKRVVQTGKKATGNYYDPFWNVEFLAGTTEINDVLRVNNDLIIRQGAVLDASLGNNPVFLKGDWLNDGGKFVPRQGRVTIEGVKYNSSGIAILTYITKNRTAGVSGGVENFFDLAIYKQDGPGSTVSAVIGGNPNNVILNNRVTVANGLIFYRGRFVSVTDKEMILLENAEFVRTPRDGNGNAFSPLILNALQSLSTPPPPGGPSTQVDQYSCYVNGPVGRFYSSSTSDVAGKFPVSKDGEYIAHPTDGVKLTIRLSNNLPTVFSVEQFNANPDFPVPPASRIISEPLNYISQSRYWVVKNIAASSVPFPGTSVAELSEGSISLPYRGAQEAVPFVHGHNYPNFAHVEAMAKLLQLSIVQDSASYTKPYAASVLRGTAPKGTHWNNLGGIISPTTSVTTINTEEKFTTLGNGVFTFGFNYTPLPAEILSLTARPRNGEIDVVWVAAGEENVVDYLVQRSMNGRDFQTIGRVAGRKSGTTQSYQFVDRQPLSGTNYYRLEQVDIHQLSSLSKTVSASLGSVSSATKGEITVYPNPIEGHQTEISILVPEEVRGAVQVSLLDMKGQSVYSQRHQADSQQIIRINPGRQLPTGMYIVNVISGEGIFQKKLVVR